MAPRKLFLSSIRKRRGRPRRYSGRRYGKRRKKNSGWKMKQMLEYKNPQTTRFTKKVWMSAHNTYVKAASTADGNGKVNLFSGTSGTQYCNTPRLGADSAKPLGWAELIQDYGKYTVIAARCTAILSPIPTTQTQDSLNNIMIGMLIVDENLKPLPLDWSNVKLRSRFKKNFKEISWMANGNAKRISTTAHWSIKMMSTLDDGDYLNDPSVLALTTADPTIKHAFYLYAYHTHDRAAALFPVFEIEYTISYLVVFQDPLPHGAI